MEKEPLMPADEFCTYYKVEYSFIDSLQQYGLIELTTIEQRGYIPYGQLQELEKFIRLHYELDINLEGIEAIHHLLQRVQHMQNEIATLKNRLRSYDSITPPDRPSI